MTNFEKEKQRINAMSAEEFVDKYFIIYDCDRCVYEPETCKTNCPEGIGKWLESEVK